MKRIYFVLPFLLTTSFLAGCGGSAPVDSLAALKLTVQANRNETISFVHDNKDEITVNWGNGVINDKCSNVYKKANIYTITITGTLNSFGYTSDRYESLISVTIGDVVSLAEETFYNCSNLKVVKWSRNVRLKEISEQAFYGCSNLTSIVIPDSVTSIKDEAFAYCNKLTSVTIPNSVVSVGEGAFHACVNLRVYKEKNINYLGNYTNKCLLALSADGDGTYTISNQCKILYPNIFKGKSIASINIPDSVVVIGRGAFQDCKQLETVLINPSSSLKEIDYGAFRSCVALNSIAIPDSVTSIGVLSFDGCAALKTVSINLSSSLQTINNFAFQNCANLNSIIIPDSIVFIGEGAFDGCGELPLYEEGNINYLGNSNNKYMLALSVANDVSEYIIEEHCKLLCPCIFKEKGLTSIVIPDGVFFIGDKAFRDCKQLEVVSINSSSSLKEINCSVFEGCNALASITIPDRVTSIGDWAFLECDKLGSITIPGDVASIGSIAFCGCNVLSIVDLTRLNHVPLGINNMFDSSPNIHIYVRSDMLEAFKTAEGWSEYADKITDDPIPEVTL